MALSKIGSNQLKTLSSKLTLTAADGAADNDWAMDVRNDEQTNDRSFGLRVSAGSTSTDRALDVLDHAQANTLLRVNGAGHVTKPKQPAFQAYYANNSYCWSDTTDGNFDLQTLNQTRFNRGNHYNTTNHRFIAPVAGVYHFYGQFFTNYASNYARCGVQIRVNGTGITETWTPNWETAGSGTSSLTIELAANDYVQLYTALYDGNATSNSYNVYCGASLTYLTGHLIG